MQSRLSDAGAAHNGANVIQRERESASGPFFCGAPLIEFFFTFVSFDFFYLHLCAALFYFNHEPLMDAELPAETRGSEIIRRMHIYKKRRVGK
jgi:hypothetical protein